MVNPDNLRMVLVGTTHPGNIGASARAMKTMGLTRLVLVQPQRYPCAEATAMASGADDLLHRAPVVDNLDRALADCVLVVGASARPRGLTFPELDPRAAARLLIEAAAQAPVALVFGRESSGLSNDELDRCQYMVRIPANPGYSSLNLAAAVQVLAYELRLALLDQEPGQSVEASEPAPYQELERFYEHLQEVLLATGFLDPANPRHLMRRLRRLFNRARPDRNEINILRGILSSVQDWRRGS
jgi:TrmH family RNA methyltransferase